MTPYDFANIQIQKHVNEVPIVQMMERLIRPIISPKNPIVGRPIMTPAENMPVITLPCCCVNPMDTAKSESEYITLTYPNNIKNPHIITQTNPKFRSNDTSNDRYLAEIIFIRSLRTRMTMELTKKMQNAVIRNAQAKPIFSIIKFVQIENKTPPAPDPAAHIPLANARRLLNHWFGNGTDATNNNPIPIPNIAPWVRKSCQI